MVRPRKDHGAGKLTIRTATADKFSRRLIRLWRKAVYDSDESFNESTIRRIVDRLVERRPPARRSRFMAKGGCGLRVGSRFLCCLQEPVLRLALNPDCTFSLLKTQRRGAAFPVFTTGSGCLPDVVCR